MIEIYQMGKNICRKKKSLEKNATNIENLIDSFYRWCQFLETHGEQPWQLQIQIYTNIRSNYRKLSELGENPMAGFLCDSASKNLIGFYRTIGSNKIQ